MSVSLSYSLHIIVTDSTVALLYCDLLPTPSSIMQSAMITVNFKVKTEFTNTRSTVEVKTDDSRAVIDLVNEALKIDSLNNEYYKDIKVTGRSNNAEIEINDLTTAFNTFQGGTVLDISYNRDPTDEEKIEIMKYYTYRPSDYGSKDNEWRNFQLSFMKVPICDHREGRVGDDVTLYYQGFQQFIDNCNGMIKPSKSDFYFAKKVCADMSQYFTKEKERENAFANAIKGYFKLDNNDVVQSNQEKKPGKSEPDIVIGPNSCVITEVKNESGQGGSDSHSQVIAYYVQSLEKRKPYQCPAPAYLIELVGPQLTISGAVFGRYVFVDKLIDPVELVPQHNEEAIIKIARIFRALKEAYGKIQQYYEKVPESQPRFPTYQIFCEGSIQYVKAIKSHTYEGTLTYDFDDTKPGMDVIIKFVKEYSCEAHEFMHKEGHAPKLILYDVGCTQYKAIIMEKISFSQLSFEYNPISECPKDTCDKFIAAITKLHKKGYYHGNLLPKYLAIKEGKIYILNYKWAIKQEATYMYPFSDSPTQEKENLEKLFK